MTNVRDLNDVSTEIDFKEKRESTPPVFSCIKDKLSPKIFDILFKLQTELVVQKKRRNDFHKYSYRNAEDIITSLKPILKKSNAILKFDHKFLDSAVHLRIWLLGRVHTNNYYN